MTLLKPVWMQPTGADPSLYYAGSELRQFAQALISAEGVIGPLSLIVAQRGAGANFSVDIAAGQCAIQGGDVANQGMYVCTNTAGAYNLVTPGAPGSGTRYHRVVAQIRDKTSNGSWTTYDWIPVLVQDTGAGLPAEPVSAISLAQVAISLGQVSVLNANITDLRPVIQPLQPYAGQTASVMTSQTRANASYGDLATVGPAVTVNTGTAARVTITALAQVDTTSAWAFMSFAISGATTLAASDTNSWQWNASVGATNGSTMSMSRVITGLTPGSNVFTAKYRSSNVSYTGTFTNRFITVEPL
jgi:hypothetical protein